MTILGLHFRSGLLLACSSINTKYEQGIWQTPLELSGDVFCVCTTHAQHREPLRLFIENVRMGCNQQLLTPQLVAKLIQRKLLMQRDLHSYIQLIVGGIDRSLGQTTLYSIINGVLLEYSTYCVGAYEARCHNIQGYIDSQYSSNMSQRDAIHLSRKILTVVNKNVVIDMIVIQMHPPNVRRLSFYKDEATKYNVDLEYARPKYSKKKGRGDLSDTSGNEDLSNDD